MRFYVKWVTVQTGVPEDLERLEELLKDRWEPFAVTQKDMIAFTYHLRQMDIS